MSGRLHGRTVWLRMEGLLSKDDAARFAEDVGKALRRTRDHLVIDLERLIELEHEAAAHFAECLKEYRERIRILAPVELSRAAAAALTAFTLYTGTGGTQ